MHAANPEKSKRLQRVLAVLRDRRWHTTWFISRRANVCAVNSIIGELRQAGHIIPPCRQEVIRGSRVFSYRWEGRRRAGSVS